MSNAAVIKLVITPGLLTGLSVSALNAVNIKKSPEYKPPIGIIGTMRFATLITVKGIVYGTFYPIALLSIFLDTCCESHFNRHFVPFSKYRMD
jgi:hypothetical protein